MVGFKIHKTKFKIFQSIFVSPGISKNHKLLKMQKNKVKISSDIELFLTELE